MKKTVVVSGSTGLIGRELVRNLINRGDRVIIVTTNTLSAAEIFPALKQDIVLWEDIYSLKDKKIDAIINLSGKNAGTQRWNRKVKKEIYDSRVLSARRLAELIKVMSIKPEVMVNASGVDYYGNRGEETITEGSSPGFDFLSGVCIDWEKEAYNAVDFGVRVVIMRTGFVLSGKSGAFRKLILPFKLFAGGTIGSGRQYVSWIHIDDLIEIYMLAIDNKNIEGAVNAVSPNPVTMKKLCKTIAKVLHRPSLIPAPSFIVKLAVGEMSQVILNGRKALPEKLLNAGFRFKYEQIYDACKKEM